MNWLLPLIISMIVGFVSVEISNIKNKDIAVLLAFLWGGAVMALVYIYVEVW